MAKIVIDIDDKDYKVFMELMTGNLYRSNYKNIIGKCLDAIKHGLVLPKGHGDLIDRNDLFKKKYCIEDEWNGGEKDIIDAIDVAMADTIIETDKEKENESVS